MTAWCGGVAKRFPVELARRRARLHVRCRRHARAPRPRRPRARPAGRARGARARSARRGGRSCCSPTPATSPRRPSRRVCARTGSPVSDDELLTPIDSATSYLLRRHRGQPVQLFANDAVHEHMTAAGVNVTRGDDAEVVFVAHQQQVDLDEVERAARAIERGAPLLTSSYVRGYAGANGMILSRGAMITAAVAKAGGRRPRVVGKPSRAAVAELARPSRRAVSANRRDRRRRAHGHRARQARRLAHDPRAQRDQRQTCRLEQLPAGQRPGRGDRRRRRAARRICSDGRWLAEAMQSARSPVGHAASRACSWHEHPVVADAPTARGAQLRSLRRSRSPSALVLEWLSSPSSSTTSLASGQ